MIETLKDLLSNPYFLTLVELFGKIIVLVLGIMIYRRSGRNVTQSNQNPNPHALTTDDLDEFALSLVATVDKISELKNKKDGK